MDNIETTQDINKEILILNERPQNMSYEDYRKLRTEGVKAIREHLKGEFFHVSKSKPNKAGETFEGSVDLEKDVKMLKREVKRREKNGE